MKHAREDYNRIQDPAALIAKDEPVFLIRGNDRVAPDVVDTWANLAEKVGANENIVMAARKHADLMRSWQAENGSKVPDMPD